MKRSRDTFEDVIGFLCTAYAACLGIAMLAFGVAYHQTTQACLGALLAMFGFFAMGIFVGLMFEDD